MSYRLWKRWTDLAVAALLLLATAPLLALTALLLLICQGRPIIFRQPRVGLHGQPFILLKFRTMTDGKPRRPTDRPVVKLPHDPRITPLGRVLRRLAIDELPQLVNVLRGEMSLVGPRPLPQADLEHPGWLEHVTPQERARRLDWQRRRQQAPPGLTGRWQITSQPEEDFENWIVNDLAYVEHPTYWGDLLILLCTPPAVLRGRAAARSAPTPAVQHRGQSKENTV